MMRTERRSVCAVEDTASRDISRERRLAAALLILVPCFILSLSEDPEPRSENTCVLTDSSARSSRLCCSVPCWLPVAAALLHHLRRPPHQPPPNQPPRQQRQSPLPHQQR